MSGTSRAVVVVNESSDGTKPLTLNRLRLSKKKKEEEYHKLPVVKMTLIDK